MKDIAPVNIAIDDFLDENTLIIADTHLFHENIIAYTNRPLNHNQLIIFNWNTIVSPEDIILHLGDVILAPTKIMRDIAPLLTGKKYVIKGNHDSRRKLRNHMGFSTVARSSFTWKNNRRKYHYARSKKYGVIFSHEPLPTGYLRKRHIVNIHGHIHNRETIDNMHINMSVEVRGYRPYKFSEILKEIDNVYGLQKLNSERKSQTIATKNT